jgi:hypothetical protein
MVNSLCIKYYATCGQNEINSDLKIWKITILTLVNQLGFIFNPSSLVARGKNCYRNLVKTINLLWLTKLINNVNYLLAWWCVWSQHYKVACEINSPTHLLLLYYVTNADWNKRTCITFFLKMKSKTNTTWIIYKNKNK